MKTLGEFVGLTEQFVQDQGQIASQTQVLALNASLVAARASEQQNPRQFLVAAKEFEAIADQVSKLAQLTNDSLSVLEQRTTQIQSVVAVVDAEVQNLGGLVGGFTQGVDKSTEAFSNVQAVTTNVVQAGETVTQSSQEIISTVQSTATTMRDIAQLAQRTAQLTQNARTQSEAMGQLSAQLLQRVEFFRLPAAVVPQSPQPKPVSLAQTEENTIDVAMTK
jgi:twitching motility protein PilJ